MGQNILLVLREMMENARKNGYQASAKALSTVIGDLQRIDKDYISSTQLLAYIKSQVKASDKAQEQAAKVGKSFAVDADYFQVLADLEDEFAPRQLTEHEIREFMLTKFEDGLTNKGLLMKALKERFNPASYDGKLAAQIAGEFNKTDKVS